jgi:hypothetical protein
MIGGDAGRMRMAVEPIGVVILVVGGESMPYIYN